MILAQSGGNEGPRRPDSRNQAFGTSIGLELKTANGRVKSIRLLTSASFCAERIGEPTGDWASPPFSVREKLDCGAIVWRHHPRCCYD